MSYCARHSEGYLKVDEPKMRQSYRDVKVVSIQGCPPEGANID